MTISDINDLPNAPAATTLVPKVPEDNALYLHGIRLASLQQREATELAVCKNEESEDVLPTRSLEMRFRDATS